MMRRLLQWWRLDRIRPHLREGRFLRIGPGTALNVEGRHATIHSRQEGEIDGRPVIHCQGMTLEGAISLRIETRNSGHGVRILWREGDGSWEIDPSAIELYGTPSSGS